MFAGVAASSSTPYGYEFYGNQPLAWYDASLADSMMQMEVTRFQLGGQDGRAKCQPRIGHLPKAQPANNQ